MSFRSGTDDEVALLTEYNVSGLVVPYPSLIGDGCRLWTVLTSDYRYRWRIHSLHHPGHVHREKTGVYSRHELECLDIGQANTPEEFLNIVKEDIASPIIPPSEKKRKVR